MDSIERQSMRDVHDGEVLQEVILVGLEDECLWICVLVGLEGDVLRPGQDLVAAGGGPLFFALAVEVR